MVCFIRIVYIGYGGGVKPITYLYILTPGYNKYNRMNEYNLTEDEMRVAVNAAITKAYPKLIQDHKRITGYNYQQFEELLPFCLEQFLTKKDIRYQYKVCCIDNAVANYFGRSMSLNLKSSSSPYWNKIRKQSYNYRGVYLVETEDAYIKREYDVINDPGVQDEFDCMMYQLEKLDFYHKPLVTDYYLNQMTFKEMYEKYGISVKHLKTAIEEGLQIIRTECKKQLEE